MAVYLDGTAYFNLNSDYSAIDFTGNFTLFAWVNPARITSGDNVFSKWNNDSIPTNGQIRWRVGPSSKNEITIRGSTTTYGPIQSSNSFTQDVWNSCGGVRYGTGTGQVSSWLNGTETTGTASQAPQNTSQVWQIGAEGNGNQLYGRIAELSAWNVALSVAEMQALSAGAAPPLIRRASLVYYVPFNHSSLGTTARDFSGNALAATAVNTPSYYTPHSRVGRWMPMPS